METCYRHPNRQTGVSCSSCGRPRCPECARQRTKVRTARTLSGEPRATQALIAANIIVFLGVAVSGAGFGDNYLATEIGQRGALFGPAVANGDIWRLVTSGFIHAG